MDDIKRILVVTKSTKHCKKAVLHGISLARHYQAELQVLHLMHDPFGLEHWQLAIPSLKAIQQEHQQMRDTARKDLDAMVAAEQAQGLNIKVDLAEGHPEKEILQAVKEKKIDLLITIAHAEGHLEQLLFGRINEELHRMLPCSLMFIKHEPGPVRW
jgi:nucleotide-binding universal stress UspA family protein